MNTHSQPDDIYAELGDLAALVGPGQMGVVETETEFIVFWPARQSGELRIFRVDRAEVPEGSMPMPLDALEDVLPPSRMAELRHMGGEEA